MNWNWSMSKYVVHIDTIIICYASLSFVSFLSFVHNGEYISFQWNSNLFCVCFDCSEFHSLKWRFAYLLCKKLFAWSIVANLVTFAHIPNDCFVTVSAGLTLSHCFCLTICHCIRIIKKKKKQKGELIDNRGFQPSHTVGGYRRRYYVLRFVDADERAGTLQKFT